MGPTSQDGKHIVSKAPPGVRVYEDSERTDLPEGYESPGAGGAPCPHDRV